MPTIPSIIFQGLQESQEDWRANSPGENHPRAVKDKTKKDGFASICDQAGLGNNCPCLVEVKDLFF